MTRRADRAWARTRGDIQSEERLSRSRKPSASRASSRRAPQPRAVSRSYHVPPSSWFDRQVERRRHLSETNQPESVSPTPRRLLRLYESLPCPSKAAARPYGQSRRQLPGSIRGVVMTTRQEPAATPPARPVGYGPHPPLATDRGHRSLIGAESARCLKQLVSRIGRPLVQGPVDVLSLEGFGQFQPPVP